MLHLAEQSGQEDEVNRPVTDDLIGNVHVPALCVSGLGNHNASVPRQTHGCNDVSRPLPNESGAGHLPMRIESGRLNELGADEEFIESRDHSDLPADGSLARAEPE